jgi:hypothetical protein
VRTGGAAGPFPFHLHSALTSTAFVALTLLLTDLRDRAARVFALSYAAATIAVAVVANPIGGNIVRLAQLAALPMLWHLLPRLHIPRLPIPRLPISRRVLVGTLVLLAASWPAIPSLSSIGRGATDPSQSAAFYTGLLRFLRTQDPARGRLEVVFTREHWEALWVAQAFPIARGWERQTDLQVNQTLYHPLTATTYRSWLDNHAVALVALPHAPIDYGCDPEADLLQQPPGYLIPVWHNANWQVWRVRHAQPLVSGPATLTDLGPASFTLDFHRPGTATVRIRSSGMWQLDQGEGCLGATPKGWLTVSVQTPQDVTVRSRLGIDTLDAHITRRCT